MSVVQIENVFKDYQMGGQQVQALKNITLNIEDGVFLAIAGPSGSGKSTLLNMIGCIDTVSAARLYQRRWMSAAKTPDSASPISVGTDYRFHFPDI
jgi:putative ABC transport system ATP-binding protein